MLNFRRTLLRIMLAALALAAVSGALGILNAAGETLWRFVGTNFLTAAAIALMLPASKAMDNAKRRDGGLAGLIWIVGGFLLTLALVWLADRSSTHIEDRLGLLILIWCLCGIPAVILCFALHAARFWIAARTGLAILAVIFVPLTIGVLINPESHIFENVVLTSVALAGFGSAALLNLANAGSGDRRYFRWAGIAAAMLGFIASTAMIWSNDYSHGEAGARILTALASVSLLTGILNVLLLIPLSGWQIYVRWGSLAAAAVCALCLNILVSHQSNDMGEIGRLMGAAGIAAACGMLALTIIARLNRRGDYTPAESSMPMFAMWAICPRCKSKQHFPVNGAACTACHLRVDIRIEEPRCVKCNYLLYMLKSPNCPECGTPVIDAPAASHPSAKLSRP